MNRCLILKDYQPLITAYCANRFFLRLRGLIGRGIRNVEGMLITPCDQIHTCFMSYPIDVVYLSRENKIVKIDFSVPPGRFCRIVPHARAVLELRAGVSEDLNLNVGDLLMVGPQY